MGKLTIVPFGGLGNRLRAFNSSLYLSKDLGLELQLVWIKKFELNAGINDLYKDLGGEVNIVKGLKYHLFKYFLKHIYIQKYPKIYFFFLSFFYDLILFDEDLINGDYELLKNRFKGKSNILIATCYAFYPFESFNNLILKDQIRTSIDNIVLPNKAVGVHIRRTDHSEIIKESGIESYLEKMNEEIILDKNTAFYLATDDCEVKNEIFSKFPNVYANPTILNRDSLEGIIGAVIDIYKLSECSKIICNPKSSFATTAQNIGVKKQLIIV